MIKLNARVELNKRKLERKQANALQSAQFMVDEDVLKDSNYFIPMRRGYLRDSSLRASWLGQGQIVWDMPYARRLYYNPQYDFSTDRNPKARGLWFEAAKSLYKDDWLEKAKEAYADHFDGR